MLQVLKKIILYTNLPYVVFINFFKSPIFLNIILEYSLLFRGLNLTY